MNRPRPHEAQALALGALMLIAAGFLATVIQEHAATQQPTSVEWGQP